MITYFYQIQTYPYLQCFQKILKNYSYFFNQNFKIHNYYYYYFIFFLLKLFIIIIVFIIKLITFTSSIFQNPIMINIIKVIFNFNKFKKNQCMTSFRSRNFYQRPLFQNQIQLIFKKDFKSFIPTYFPFTQQYLKQNVWQQQNFNFLKKICQEINNCSFANHLIFYQKIFKKNFSKIRLIIIQE